MCYCDTNVNKSLLPCGSGKNFPIISTINGSESELIIFFIGVPKLDKIFVKKYAPLILFQEKYSYFEN